MLENSYRKGIKDGIPICLGYLSVSFAFGLAVVAAGLPWQIAVLISATNLTSAGQVAGLGILVSGGSAIEMALAQLIINLRYSLMSISLSQKMCPGVTVADRFGIGFFITDEIFAVASGKPGEVGKRYMYGLATMPFFGWTIGTLLGAVAGTFLPQPISNALGLAIYGMFIAIIIPPMQKDKAVTLVACIAAAMSCVFCYVPFVKKIFERISGGTGFIIIICAVAAAVIGALLKPIGDETAENADA